MIPTVSLGSEVVKVLELVPASSEMPDTTNFASLYNERTDDVYD